MPLRRLPVDLGPQLVLILTCIAGGWFKLQCGAWHDAVQYVTGCYSDAVPFWGLRGVAAGEIPYLQARLEYPVLTGALIWIEGGLTRLLWGARADAQHFLLVVTAVNVFFAFWVLDLMEAAGVSPARRYAWAAGPPLVLYLGHNWDMLAVTLVVAAFLAATRQRAIASAALAALGTAAKLFPILMLPLIGLGALFRPGSTWRARLVLAALVTIAAIAAWSAVNLPVALASFERWSEFYTFSQDRPGTAASAWEIMSMQAWWQTTPAVRNKWSFALFVAGAAAIVALGWRRHGTAPWLLFAPVLAWFLLTSKVYSPQFDLWLWPFLVLTCHRWWLLAWFAAGDIACYFAEFWWFAAMEGHGPGTATWHIALAAAVRATAMLAIIADGVFAAPPAWLCPTARQPGTGAREESI